MLRPLCAATLEMASVAHPDFWAAPGIEGPDAHQKQFGGAQRGEKAGSGNIIPLSITYLRTAFQFWQLRHGTVAPQVGDNYESG